MTKRLASLPLAAVMAGTTFVAVTAFVLAYDGSRGAAQDAGISQAQWYPFCIEGVIVCASVATLRLRRRVYPWLILLAFTAVSVAANVLHAWEQPGAKWWSLAFAAVPPLALPICVHLLLMVGRSPAIPTKEETGGQPAQHDQRQGLQGTAGQGPQGQPGLVQQEGDRATEGQSEAVGEAQVVVANGNGHGVTLRAQAEREARRYLEENGVLPSENVLAGLARCSRGTARNALAPLRKG